MIKNAEIDLIVNTTEGKQAILESNSIRREAVHRRITYYTTLAAALATCEALDHIDEVDVNRLQDLHKEVLSISATSTVRLAGLPANLTRREVGT